jgi:4-oxalocrotonate tautomerase
LRSGPDARRATITGDSVPSVLNLSGGVMPFVNIQILAGHSQQRKDQIAKRVVAAISEVAELPSEAIWVVFEDVRSDDWFVGGTSVTEHKKAAR